MDVPRCATTVDPDMAVAGPLSEIRVIELGSFIAAPCCGQMLADLGAEVVKIEPPGKGDTMRQWGNARSSNGQSLGWSVIGGNKHSITLDLRQPEGQQILRKLLREVDVVVENFRPGTLEGWGIGPEALRAENPDLIVARASGFGWTGPYSHKAGFGSIVEALSRLRALCGEADRMPSCMGGSIGDSVAGLFATTGVLFALLGRGRAGGQDIDLSIVESVLAVMESSVPDFAGEGYRHQRNGPALAGIAPSNHYPTADGVPILIAPNAVGLFRSLAMVMDQPELAERSEFAPHAARGQNQQVLDGLIADWTETRPLAKLLALMERRATPAGPVNDIGAVLADPHLRPQCLRRYARQGSGPDHHAECRAAPVADAGGECAGPPRVWAPTRRKSLKCALALAATRLLICTQGASHEQYPPDRTWAQRSRRCWTVTRKAAPDAPFWPATASLHEKLAA